MFKKLFLAGALFFAPCFADQTIEIVKKVTPTVSIHVSVDSAPAVDSLKLKMLKMLQADLKVVGIFKVEERHDAKTDYLAKVYLEKESNFIKAKFLIKDSSQKIIFNRTYNLAKEDRYPFLCHKFAIEFAEKFGIKDVAWMERLILFTKTVRSGQTQIFISDYSLTFKKPVVTGGINIFPKWADANQESFYYTKYEDRPTLYKLNLYTGQKTKIISSDGMLVASDVSKDGKRLLVTMAVNGQPDIFEIDLERKTQKRLTIYKGIDVNGKYIEDEKSFVFVSDRFGYPEIFKGRVGSNFVEQLVFKGRNNNYVDGFKDYVLFVSRDSDSEFGKNTFNVYLISTKTEYIRQLTSIGQNFFPRFSGDGNTIIYIKELRNESALGIIRLNQNKSFEFPLKRGKFQSIDW
ncbi:MAG: Tol-Pal system protein TolB [Helicobacteraceae bacterium]